MESLVIPLFAERGRTISAGNHAPFFGVAEMLADEREKQLESRTVLADTCARARACPAAPLPPRFDGHEDSRRFRACCSVLVSLKHAFVCFPPRGEGRYCDLGMILKVDFLRVMAESGEAGPSMPALNTKGYSSTDLTMGFANVRAGTQKRRAVFGYPPEH